MADLQSLLSVFLQQLYAGSVTLPGAGTLLAGDGTSGAPAIAFASAPTTGFYLSAPTSVTLAGSSGLIANGLQSNASINLAAASIFFWATRGVINSPADGVFAFKPNGQTLGSEIKVDALPTIASGFGTAAAVTAGSTPFAGSVNVGTGGVATTGALTWNGTAFPSAPFIVCTCSAGTVPTIVTATTTGVTFTSSVAWPASTILNWIAISAK